MFANVRRNCDIVILEVREESALLNKMAKNECQPGKLMRWYDDDGRHLIGEDCELDFIIEDVGNAIKALDGIMQNISNLGVLIG